MIWYTKQLVRARAARTTFGIEVQRLFEAGTPSHQVRQNLTYVNPRGETCLRWIFDPLVIQVCYLSSHDRRICLELLDRTELSIEKSLSLEHTSVT